MNSVIEVMPLGTRLDVPLLRRAMSESDTRAPAQQQKQLPATGAESTTFVSAVFPLGTETVGLSPNFDRRNASDSLAEPKSHRNHPLTYIPTSPPVPTNSENAIADR